MTRDCANTKYIWFFFSVLVWLCGGICLAIGIYVRFGNPSIYLYFFGNVWQDPAFYFMIVGGIRFILGITGCVGALRENIRLLKFFYIALAVICFMQYWSSIALFGFREQLEKVVNDKLQETVISYHNNVDSKSLIDKVQIDFECCGANDYNDWNDNIYFNCSQLTNESCGVPSSCCCKDKDNKKCGYGVRKEGILAEEHVYTRGCVKGFERNIMVIYFIALSMAFFESIALICYITLVIEDRRARSKSVTICNRQIKETSNCTYPP